MPGGVRIDLRAARCPAKSLAGGWSAARRRRVRGRRRSRRAGCRRASRAAGCGGARRRLAPVRQARSATRTVPGTGDDARRRAATVVPGGVDSWRDRCGTRCRRRRAGVLDAAAWSRRRADGGGSTCGARDQRRRAADTEVLLRADVDRLQIGFGDLLRRARCAASAASRCRSGRSAGRCPRTAASERHVNRARETAERLAARPPQQAGEQVRFAVAQPQPRRHLALTRTTGC